MVWNVLEMRPNVFGRRHFPDLSISFSWLHVICHAVHQNPILPSSERAELFQNASIL